MAFERPARRQVIYAARGATTPTVQEGTDALIRGGRRREYCRQADVSNAGANLKGWLSDKEGGSLNENSADGQLSYKAAEQTSTFGDIGERSERPPMGPYRREALGQQYLDFNLIRR